MELTINRDVLLDAVSRCLGVAQRGKGSVPILNHALIEHRDSNVYLKATDLEVGVAVILPLAAEGTDGVITLPAKKLAEVLKNAEAETISIKTLDNDRVEIKAGRASFKIMGLDPRSFPAMPADAEALKRKEGEGSLTLSAACLAEMLDKTLFAVSADEARYNLSGVYFEATEGGVRAVSTDGHRLALVERQADGFALSKGVILPRAALAEARKLLDGHEGAVTLEIGDSAAILGVGDTTLSMRLVEAEFPDYRGVMPKESKSAITLNRADFEGAVRRARVMSNERYNGVKLALGAELVVSSTSVELGEAQDEVAIEAREGDAAELAIGVNAGYLLDPLKAIPADAGVKLAFIDDTAAMVLTTPADDAWRVVIMPMRL